MRRKPLKRKPLRPKLPDKPWQVQAKKDRLEYLLLYPICQYCLALWAHQRLHKWPAKAVEIEHIWNRKGPSSECWSNWASTCRQCHDWKHSNEIAGRIAITCFKSRLAQEGDQRHLNPVDWRNAAGFHVPAWIERKLSEPGLPAWAVKMGQDFLGGDWWT